MRAFLLNVYCDILFQQLLYRLILYCCIIIFIIFYLYFLPCVNRVFHSDPVAAINA